MTQDPAPSIKDVFSIFYLAVAKNTVFPEILSSTSPSENGCWVVDVDANWWFDMFHGNYLGNLRVANPKREKKK